MSLPQVHGNSPDADAAARRWRLPACDRLLAKGTVESRIALARIRVLITTRIRIWIISVTIIIRLIILITNYNNHNL